MGNEIQQNIQNGPVESTIYPLQKVDLKKFIGVLRLDQKFLQFCITNLEKPEREGKLPRKYSTLNVQDVQKMVDGVDITIPEIENSEKNLELDRLREASEMIKNHENKASVVKTIEGAINPLGEINDATLILVSDDHESPSYVKEGIRAQSFKRYSVERTLTGLLAALKNEKKVSGLPSLQEAEYNSGEDLPSKGMVEKYIGRTDSIHLFREWLKELVSKGRFREDNLDMSKPIIFSLGDRVHDGAFFLDQLDAESAYHQMIDEINKKNPVLDTKLLEIDGNHDRDSRIPESTLMLTELFGQRIFAQEIGGVLVAAVDTNIENPVWVSDFLERTKGDGKSILDLKRKFQEEILQKVMEYQGDVILVGHHPIRLVEAFGVNRDILQKSNVVGLIGGHTHKESHFTTPLYNRNGTNISLHVLDSSCRVDKDGKPIPPKAYAVRIHNGKIGPVRTFQENKNLSDKRYQEFLITQNLS